MPRRRAVGGGMQGTYARGAGIGQAEVVTEGHQDPDDQDSNNNRHHDLCECVCLCEHKLQESGEC